MNNDNTIDEEAWGVFGGCVGMGTSEFKTFEEADKFCNDFINLDLKELVKLYPDIVVE